MSSADSPILIDGEKTGIVGGVGFYPAEEGLGGGIPEVVTQTTFQAFRDAEAEFRGTQLSIA
ncbi:MAG: hypothetical protein J6B97_04930 [Bacteroidales bacterium]|nr:hypothetical protein [Bacteroidales bacterium]